jgi:hypothetical protein
MPAHLLPKGPHFEGQRLATGALGALGVEAPRASDDTPVEVGQRQHARLHRPRQAEPHGEHSEPHGHEA